MKYTLVRSFLIVFFSRVLSPSRQQVYTLYPSVHDWTSLTLQANVFDLGYVEFVTVTVLVDDNLDSALKSPRGAGMYVESYKVSKNKRILWISSHGEDR